MPHQTQRLCRPQRITRRKVYAETIDTIKDAIGVFAILTMLYVGLFIPSI